MYIREIGENLFQVELGTGGFEQLICSYVIFGSRPVVVEAGPDSSVSRLLLGMQELGVRPEEAEFVFVTHVHLDHGGGAGRLLEHLPNAKVVVHPRGAPHLVDPGRLWRSAQGVLGFVSGVFGEPLPVPKERIISLTQGSFDLGGGGRLDVLETVGHASHNLSFQETFNGGVFPGDAAGTYLPDWKVVVPTTPPPFHLESALASIDSLIALDPSALYFSHFGKAKDAFRRLEDYKVQLRLWADVAEVGVKNGRSFGEIRDRIIAADPVMTMVADYVKAHRIYSRTVLENCVLGFVEYAKKKLGRV